MRPDPILLVDTNVWADHYLYRLHGSSDAREFMRCVRSEGVNIVYPIHVLKDVFYIVQREMKSAAREEGRLTESAARAIREIAWSCVENMREMATAIAADDSDAFMACKYRALLDDLEDDLVLAAAKRAHADLLVTNDKQLRRRAPIPVLAPADAVQALKTARWGTGGAGPK